MNIRIKPVSALGRILDVVLRPRMLVLSGTFRESPQETHWWNNQKLSYFDVRDLDRGLGQVWWSIPGEKPMKWFGLPIGHMPIFGGWRNYIVLRPSSGEETWHVGWVTPGSAGVSRIPITGEVRMLIGSSDVLFFGADAHGRQIRIEVSGRGKVGDGSQFFCRITLR